MRLLAAPFLALLASALCAQTSYIIPKPANSVPGNLINTTSDVPFYGHTTVTGTYGRFQYFYDVNTIPATAAVFKAIAWRQWLNGNGGRALPGSSGGYKITMDVVPAQHDKVSLTFNNNYSPSHKTVVFDGTISFPATLGTGGTWPMPWEATLPFNKTSYLYVQSNGKSLMVETEASTTAVNKNFPYSIEAYRAEDGRRGVNEANTLCMNTATTRPTTATHDDSGLTSIFVPNLVPGGHWQMTAYPYPTNSNQFKPSFCVLGFTGKGGTYLGKTLPFTLQSIGLVSTSVGYCNLGNSIDLLLPAVYNATAGTVQGPKATIPSLPAAIGFVFYAQMASDDSGYLFPSFSHSLTIKSGNPPGGTSVRVFFQDPLMPLPTAGAFGSQSQVPTWRLDT